MNNKSKILVASPVFDGMDYCINEFLNRMRELDYEDYDILIVDNSRKNDFFNKLSNEECINLIRDANDETTNKLRLVNSRNIILEYAIKNNYDYILMMDCDVIPPKNIIKDLLKHDKDMVSGLYFNYFTVNKEQKHKPVAWCHLSPEEFEEISKQINLPEFIKSHKDMRRHMTDEEVNSGKLIKVKIPSAGCMLIKRKVFEKIKYGLLEIPEHLSTTDDMHFILKAEEAGFEAYVDTSIKCEHLIFGKFYKDKDGTLRHPVFD